MTRHFEQDLDKLKSNIIKMGSAAEQAIEKSIEAMIAHDKHLAEKIIRDDKEINNMEIVIDKIIIEILALQQPVASDLRFILAASKINNDLERIGDHAVNLAQSALKLLDMTIPLPSFEEIKNMANITKKMLSNALDSFVHGDAKIGEEVLQMDDTADNLNKKIGQEMLVIMKSNPKTIDQALELIRVSRNLERVADLATNIAEEVVFIAKAKVVKHHAADVVNQ